MKHCLRILLAWFLVPCSALTAHAQYAERPDLVGTGAAAVDISGRSIKNQRVRAVHTTDPALLGGTAYFVRRDPFLAYQLGRNLNFREFRERDGVFGPRVANLAGLNPDGTTAKITANNQTSCSGCHNLPQGTPGGGVTFHKDSGFGRNSPHYFGAGILEMLAIQIRADLLVQLDTDSSGWISATEAQAAPAQALVRPTSFGAPLEFGDPRLSNGATGRPSFNNIIRAWFVDAQGRHVPGATTVDGVSTHGYNFEVVVYGWGQGAGRAALNPTARAFLWDPYLTHSGLDSHDPSTLDDPDGDGVSRPTLAGAIQFPATHRAPDRGLVMDPLGFSRDDPDNDGHLTEISEGDLDLAEWFVLNTPRPAFAGTSNEFRRGVMQLDSLGCTQCHVMRWDIKPQSAVHAGDRRFFDFDVKWNALAERLEGRIVPLYTVQQGDYVPQRGGFETIGLFTDFRHHDLGDESAEVDFGGTVNRVWRTAPLWGVGSSFPWHHDGRSLTLDDSIRRHGGEGALARANYLAAPLALREDLVRFLTKLVLYDIESLPADIDGDGAISANFDVGGTATGGERFNAEWLFVDPVRVQGLVQNAQGLLQRSFAALNRAACYGENLALRRDTDSDGWPDVWDAAPTIPGYKDGVN